VIELSEEAEARYVKGEYVRVDTQTPIKRSRYSTDDGWTTKRDYPTGRLCLRAYCPDWRGEWTKQWRETNERDLKSRIRSKIRPRLPKLKPPRLDAKTMRSSTDPHLRLAAGILVCQANTEHATPHS
jgi:hypothetical protein